MSAATLPADQWGVHRNIRAGHYARGSRHERLFRTETGQGAGSLHGIGTHRGARAPSRQPVVGCPTDRAASYGIGAITSLS